MFQRFSPTWTSKQWRQHGSDRAHNTAPALHSEKVKCLVGTSQFPSSRPTCASHGSCHTPTDIHMWTTRQLSHTHRYPYVDHTAAVTHPQISTCGPHGSCHTPTDIHMWTTRQLSHTHRYPYVDHTAAVTHPQISICGPHGSCHTPKDIHVARPWIDAGEWRYSSFNFNPCKLLRWPADLTRRSPYSRGESPHVSLEQKAGWVPDPSVRFG